MIIYGKKVKEKKFDFEIPAIVQSSIERLIKGQNENDMLIDCYMAELACDINSALHVDFTDEQAEELRNYYIRGGMYEND
ncbi:MAG: hypothetical protein K2J32_06690 [Ruminococcus sp.]|nr:hypothetical protein [Ruminococcus sp.]